MSDHFTVGGVVGFSHGSLHRDQLSLSGTSVRIAPRIGYLIALGSAIILWPILQLDGSVSDGGTRVAASIGMRAEVAAVLPLTSHIYASLAPQLGYSITNIASIGDEHGVALAVESRFGVAF